MYLMSNQPPNNQVAFLMSIIKIPFQNVIYKSK